MKKAALFLIFAALCVLCTFPVSAEQYKSYSYSSKAGAVAAPCSYSFKEAEYFDGLKNPQDLYIIGNTVYLLDTGNNRIIVTDTGFESFSVISELKNTEKSSFNEPKGIFVNPAGEIYVADSGNRRVLKLDSDGTVIREIIKPASSKFSQTVEFIPNKLVADAMDNIYVTCTGIYNGAVMFDKNGVFLGYFGASEVTANKNVLEDVFWRQFMTAEQKEGMSKYVPAELSALDVTPDNFIFSITNSTFKVLSTEKESMDEISKLNPKGKNILNSKMSEKALKYMEKDGKKLKFADVVTDDDSFIYVVDDSLCRILQYDADLTLLTAFGGKGDADGLLKKPTAIESAGNCLYLLDSEKNSVTVYEETEFGATLRDAIKLYNKGKYDEAIEPFGKVLEMDSNYEFAYVGIGSALMGQGNYKDAMECFKKGYDSEKYNAAFKNYRIEVIRNNFPVVVAVLILLGVLSAAFAIIAKRRRKGRKNREQK